MLQPCRINLPRIQIAARKLISSVMLNRKFIYKNAQNVVAARDVNVVHEDEEYIDAFCNTTGTYKTFKKERILADVDDVNTASTLQLVAELQSKSAIIQRGNGVKWQNKMHKPEICFTGFAAKEKAELIAYAEAQDFFVRTDVSEGLSFLVCGTTAGPSKLQKARAKGVLLLNRDTFKHLAETGEIFIE